MEVRCDMWWLDSEFMLLWLLDWSEREVMDEIELGVWPKDVGWLPGWNA